MKGNGFTLIEILVVLVIVSLMLSVSMPVSYSMYQRYQASQKAEAVLVWVSAIRMDSFLYSKESVIDAQGGRLMLDGTEETRARAVTAYMDKPIKFSRNGTTSGGQIKIGVSDSIFFLDVEAPFGGIRLRRSAERG